MSAEPSDPGESPHEAPAPQIEVAANDSMSQAPFDATPSPDADRVYYTASAALDGEQQPGVFAVAANGGAIEMLAAGAPLTAPVNIAVSLDGKRLFVADPAANMVFTLPATGGTPSPLSGTEGYLPSGLAVIALKGEQSEYLYFSGRDPGSDQAGLFRVDSSGGQPTAIASGEPFSDPAGVAVAESGEAYVVETALGSATSQVIRVRGGRAEVFVSGIGIGYPAGITLTRDAKTLLVSGVDPASRHDLVYYVDAASAEIRTMTKTVGQFSDPAGLHRAHNADVFAWADSAANDTGTVYVLTP
jgi:DNA-binding beta-propeller fold protein YncE